MSTDFVLQPVLTGPRVTVRPVEEGDWDSMFAAASDPEIWMQHPVPTRYQESVFRGYFDDAVSCGSAFSFVDNESGAVIGSSRYHGLDSEKSEVEIGWTFLARAYWGGSYNAEIKKLMVEHALRFVDTVIFWVGETNMRSRRAMEKIGGVLRDGTVTRPEVGDDPYVVYEITRATTERLFELVPED